MDLTNIQKSLKGVGCPACQQKGGMTAVLRCDLGLDACMVTIECGKCNLLYEVLPETSQSRENAQHKDACPECRGVTTNQHMLCEVSSRECHYVPAPCDRCAEAAQEKSKLREKAA